MTLDSDAPSKALPGASERGNNNGADLALRLAAAIQNLSEGIALYDPEGRLLHLNSTVGEFYPSLHEQLRPGISYLDFWNLLLHNDLVDIEPNQRADWLKERQASLAAAASSTQLRLRDGRWLLITDRRTRAGDIISVHTDISDLKQREDQLRIAKEIAEVSNHAKSEFLAQISHELRTPLNAIIGFAEIIKSQTFGPITQRPYNEYIGDILSSAQRLLNVINDILEASKAEAGKLEMVESNMNAAAVISAATRMVGDLANKAEINLQLAKISPLIVIRADQRKLRQILLSLLSNAIKFTGKGGRVEVSAEVNSKDEFLIIVRDNGIGMEPEEISKALAAFAQVDQRLSRKYEGIGLGLPITQALVELHNGTLRIDSQKGVGTTVTVRLPSSRLVAKG